MSETCEESDYSLLGPATSAADIGICQFTYFLVFSTCVSKEPGISDNHPAITLLNKKALGGAVFSNMFLSNAPRHVPTL